MRRVAWLSGLCIGCSIHCFMVGRTVDSALAWMLAFVCAHLSCVFGVKKENQIIKEIEEAKAGPRGKEGEG